MNEKGRKGMDFVNLHVHTHYSTLDGMCKIDELVDRAIEMGQKAVAITDHGNMCGVYDLYKICKSKGIQPIYGIEFYHRVNGIDKRLHLIAFAKSMKGLKNLYRLHELSWRNAEVGAFGKRYPIVTYTDILQHKEDIIITSACLAGHLPQCILQKRSEEMYATIEMLRNAFGDDFYIELQSNTIKDQETVNRELVALAKLYKIKTILTADTHYVLKSDALVHEMLLCMQTQDKMDNPSRFKFSTNDYWYKSESEIRENVQGVNIDDVDEAIRNTNEIAAKCIFDLEIPKAEDALPKYSDDEKKALRQLVNKGWKEKRHGRTKKEIDRANYELDIIEQKGYSGYYLIVSDYINWAKSNNIVVGGGRGSGVGSFIAYLTGMTTINPIEHGLLFERFLNPERYTSPDFDVDFSDQDSVMRYLMRRWGENNVSRIIAFGTLTARSVIRKVMSIHGFSMAQINEVNKSLPKKLNLTLDDCSTSKMFEDYKAKHPVLWDAMCRLEGVIDHTMPHAAGVLITPKAINEFVPALYDHESGMMVAGFDKYMLEELGLYKFDILKLTTLNVIDTCIKNIKVNRGEDIDFDKIPRTDNNIFSDLCMGNVFGVFQFEGQPELTKQLQPKSFSALTAENALVRPGVGDVEEYVARMNGKPFEYFHDAERSYMEETYGTITYQEQIMMRVHTLAGWSLGKGDSLRKVKKIGNNEDLRHAFKDGCKTKGFITSDTNIDMAWREICDALEGGYSFNKSHACSYADISYQTAWLKYHYPVEFMAALMTWERDKQEQIAERVNQCKVLGIRILPPDINKSDETYKVEGDAIRFSINTIKGVGENALVEINRVVPVLGFDDFYDRVDKRIADKTVCINLISSGCFDSFNTDRYILLADYYIKRGTKQDRLIADAYNGKECTWLDVADMEKKTLGLYLTHSPYEKYNFKSLSCFATGAQAVIGGEITKIKTIFDKANRKMAFVTLTTEFNNVELIIFAKEYKAYEEQITEGAFVMITGRKENEMKMIMNQMTLL